MILWEDEDESIETYNVFENGIFIGTMELTRTRFFELLDKTGYILIPVKEDT
jgi:hypothetical protein